MSNGNGFDITEMAFKLLMGIGGTVISAATIFVGKKAIEHNREIGELKSSKEAHEDVMKGLRIDLTEMKTDIREIRNLLMEASK